VTDFCLKLQYVRGQYDVTTQLHPVLRLQINVLCFNNSVVASICKETIGSCDGVRLPSQHCGHGPVVLSPDDSECEPVSR
jgi:hypothetical protein